MNGNKKSNVEKYREKLKERAQEEKYSMNDYFGRAGNGAPLRDQSGNIVTTRKTITDDNIYKYKPSDMSINTTNVKQIFSPQPYEFFSPYFQNPSYYPQYPANLPFPYYPFISPFQLPIMPYYPTMPSWNISSDDNIRKLSAQAQEELSPHVMITNARKELLPQNSENSHLEDNKEIVPQEKRDEKSEQQRKLWQIDLLKQVEEKKKKDEENKRKEIESERIEEEKNQVYFQKKKEQELQQQLKKKNKLTTNTGIILNKNTTSANASQHNMPNTVSNINDKSANVITEAKHSDQRQIIYEKELKVNEEFKRMIGLKYENLSKTLHDDMNQEITKLNLDIRGQYVGIGGIFDNLKCQAKEVTEMRYRQLNQIQEEIEKRRLIGIVFDDNSSCISYRRPSNSNQYERQNRSLNMKSASKLITAPNENQFSSLAQAGQSLVGESEFIPISEDKPYDDFTIGKKIAIENTEREEYGEMYSKLHEITDLNSKIDRSAKYQSVNSHFEIDYAALGGKKVSKEEIIK